MTTENEAGMCKDFSQVKAMCFNKTWVRSISFSKKNGKLRGVGMNNFSVRKKLFIISCLYTPWNYTKER